jgi:predicted GNAT superfamily acetyltransferase
VLLRVGADGGPVREYPDLSAGTTVLLGVPLYFQDVKRTSLELALGWRMESRAAFEAALAAGLIAVDFRRDGTYVMARASPDASGAARAIRAFDRASPDASGAARAIRAFEKSR